MVCTHITTRIPGFLAKSERLLHPELPSGSPVAVIDGEGERARAISVEGGAGIHAGMNVEELRASECLLVPASPALYQSLHAQVVYRLSRELPWPHVSRTGVFHACWQGEGRFLEAALERARLALTQAGYRAHWGVGAHGAISEIASSIAHEDCVVHVHRGSEREFLANKPLHLLHDLDREKLRALAEIGIYTFGELAGMPDAVLRGLFGKEGPALRELARYGRRRSRASEWRGQRILAGGTADPGRVRQAVSALMSEANGAFVASGRERGRGFLALVYVDGRQASARIAPSNKHHEGHWQAEALEQVGQIWLRRAGVRAVRLAMRYGPPLSEQLPLFDADQHGSRERGLENAVLAVRQKWGRDSLGFAVARQRSTGTLQERGYG